MKANYIGALIVLLSLFLVTNFLSIAIATDYESNITVNVTVEYAVIIDVTPDVLNFAGRPGSKANPEFAYLTVFNLGSVPISNIKVRVDLPSSNPWGANNPSLHQSGEFVLIGNGSDTFRYVAQRLFSIDNPPRYLVFPSECLTNNVFDSTKCKLYVFRTAVVTTSEGEDWYVLAISNNGDFSSGSVRFAKNPKTASQTGTKDFTNTAEYDAVSLTNVNNYGYASYTFGGNSMLSGYFVVNSAGNEAYFGYWDYEVTSKVSLPTNYLRTTSLNPGAFAEFDIQVRIPYGVPQGSILGKLYIVASV